MKLSRVVLALGVMLAAGCAVKHPPAGTADRDAAAPVAELINREFAFAVLSYLCRWHSDAATLVEGKEQREVEVWVRLVYTEVDDGDRSRFAELWLPSAGLLVDLKQAAYEAPERKLVLRDEGFKIRAVHWMHPRSVEERGWTVLRFPSVEVVEGLEQARNQRLFPDTDLERRLRDALSDYLRRYHEQEWRAGGQTFYTAPMSTVSNELWIYWENKRTAVRLAADGDLRDSRTWTQEVPHLRLVRLDRETSGLPGELGGGPKQISPEWAGRLLYNCVVLGRKFSLPAPNR
jgi:hypothetical protein